MRRLSHALTQLIESSSPHASPQAQSERPQLWMRHGEAILEAHRENEGQPIFREAILRDPAVNGLPVLPSTTPLLQFGLEWHGATKAPHHGGCLIFITH